MNGKIQFQVIKPLSNLQSKIPMTGGLSEEDSLVAAEEALKDIKENFEVALREDILKIRDAISKAINTPSVIEDAISEINGISHDIKGMAATFDYHLLTHIAHSLCRFILSSKPETQMRHTVIKAHAKAMETVVSHSLKGEGGEVGRELLDILDAAVEKAV